MKVEKIYQQNDSYSPLVINFIALLHSGVKLDVSVKSTCTLHKLIEITQKRLRAKTPVINLNLYRPTPNGFDKLCFLQ